MSSQTYFDKAIFIYEDNSATLLEDIQNNPFGTQVTSFHIEEFLKDYQNILQSYEHLVISLQDASMVKLLSIAVEFQLSIGIVPLNSQKEQIRNLYTTADTNKNIEIALRADPKAIDLVKIDDTLIYSQGIIGAVPFINDRLKRLKLPFYKSFAYIIRKFFSLQLQKFEITTQNGQKIITAATAVIVLNHTTRDYLSKIFKVTQSMRDGKITLVIISPSSLFEYFRLISSIFSPKKSTTTLPPAIGTIQSKSITVTTSKSKKIKFENGEAFTLPATLQIAPDALKLNASDEFWEKNPKTSSDKETIKIANLPDKEEATKYIDKTIPLFKVASEERFKDLFLALRQDAKLDSIYLVLMVLSVLLASFGLFANSTAVIIGAMLVAPLMAPIVSLAMGLLRGEHYLAKNSLIKIAVGIGVALLASSILASVLPYTHITSEMLSRVNPTLLDLGIAIFSGVAAAYSKSHKEITQNLAGVAIAVALVPPLTVAGIGLGYLQFHIFYGAFLLFFTNLVGIVLAAIFTFLWLGFSSAVKSKKSFIFIVLLVIGISFPLYISYDQMLEKYQISRMLKSHRFIVNNKYIIIDKANVLFYKDVKVLQIKILTRESLTRDDFQELKNDIQKLFNSKLFIKSEVEYIL